MAVVDEQVVDVPDGQARRLRWFNAAMGGLHLVSGGAMVVLGNDFELPVSRFNLQGPPGTPLSDGAIAEVFGLPLAWGTATFLWISALFHFLVASPLGFGPYLRELARGRNRFRWVEYSFSASLMIVLIALLTGVTDIAALVGVAFANAAMILFGWVMELVNVPDRPTWWSPFWFGSIAGIGPWVAIILYLVLNINAADGDGPPGFVYAILVSIFVLFNCFAVNQWLQYRQVGPWSRYLFGEVVYIVLSLVAKSALAWQVFANTLIE